MEFIETLDDKLQELYQELNGHKEAVKRLEIIISRLEFARLALIEKERK